MKHLFSTLLLAIALTACSGTDKGNQAASDLKAAWGNPDAIQQVAAGYVASRDSLNIPGDASAMDKAFVDACAGNDTIHMVARAIATTPEQLGSEIATGIIDLLKADRAIDKANAQLSMADLALSLLGRNDDIATVYKAVDDAASALPEEQQMRVYVNSCTPDALAQALLQDRATDAATADRRARIVETILTGDALDTFKKTYYKQ